MQPIREGLNTNFTWTTVQELPFAHNSAEDKFDIHIQNIIKYVQLICVSKSRETDSFLKCLLVF